MNDREIARRHADEDEAEYLRQWRATHKDDQGCLSWPLGLALVLTYLWWQILCALFG
jgi:hypothetical protein